MTGLSDFVDSEGDDDEEWRELHVMTLEYEEKFGSPVIHAWCRDRDGERHWVEIEGHRPSFYAPADTYDPRIENHHWVENVERGHTSIRGESLVKIVTGLPKHVGGGRDEDGLREQFETTWEADVFYTSRFLIDTGIKTHFRLDTSETVDEQHQRGDYRVSVDDIEPIEDPDWMADPRIVTVDIEVESPDGFPEAEDADQRVTGVTAHDSHTDEYHMWVLEADNWDAYPTPHALEVGEIDVGGGIACDVVDLSTYSSEKQLLADVNEWVGLVAPDMLSGWNSSATGNGDSFDYPYLINRCRELNVSYRQWSPMEQVWTTRRGRGQNLTASGKGIIFFDMMEAYEKTQWSEPDGGWGLENISEMELPVDGAKLDVEDIDRTWKEEPAAFCEYNLRDVQAVVAIDAAVGVTELYQNLRRLTGAQFGDCHNNINLLDHYILRFAHEQGIALPTNTVPDRDWFYGGYNFEPEFGRHENTVYPDVWSEYPNAFRTCNMSPETIIGTEEDLAESEYTEDDCRWSYVDTRPTDIKQETDPEYEKCYYLKPEIKEGFMNEVVDHVMGLKEQYDGTTLYGPVKQIVNSVWGVYGDSNSYGKGYRLFDWRVAESITLYGRTVIQGTAEKFIEECNAIKDEWGFEGENAYLVGGDTDSCMAAMPFANDSHYHSANHDPSHLATIQVAFEATERINEWYDEYAADQFNADGTYIELEVESYADRTYVPEPATKSAEGKKRYCELTRWEEGEWFDPPLFSVTGIDIVRSDRATVTRELLEDVLDTILRVGDLSQARQDVYDLIETEITAIKDGKRDPSWIARPRGMGKQPEEYGSPSELPMPTYKGAKYANEHFDWANITSGDKPQLLYIERVGGGWPARYPEKWHTKEAGRPVNAVALNEPDKLPGAFQVDTDKMIAKTIEDPLAPILAPLNWSVEEALADTEQSDISTFF